MIACPRCGGSTSVTETRTNGTNVRRRRRCGCGHRVTTVEILIPDGPRQATVDLVAVPRTSLQAIAAVAQRALGSAVAMPNVTEDAEPIEEPRCEP